MVEIYLLIESVSRRMGTPHRLVALNCAIA